MSLLPSNMPEDRAVALLAQIRKSVADVATGDLFLLALALNKPGFADKVGATTEEQALVRQTLKSRITPDLASA